MNEPGGNETREISFLVAVDAMVSVQNEASLFAESSDDAGALYRLVEMTIDRGAADGLQTSQLT